MAGEIEFVDFSPNQQRHQNQVGAQWRDPNMNQAQNVEHESSADHEDDEEDTHSEDSEESEDSDDGDKYDQLLQSYMDLDCHHKSSSNIITKSPSSKKSS